MHRFSTRNSCYKLKGMKFQHNETPTKRSKSNNSYMNHYNPPQFQCIQKSFVTVLRNAWNPFIAATM